MLLSSRMQYSAMCRAVQAATCFRPQACGTVRHVGGGLSWTMLSCAPDAFDLAVGEHSMSVEQLFCLTPDKAPMPRTQHAYTAAAVKVRARWWVPGAGRSPSAACAIHPIWGGHIFYLHRPCLANGQVSSAPSEQPVLQQSRVQPYKIIPLGFPCSICCASANFIAPYARESSVQTIHQHSSLAEAQRQPDC